MAYSDDPDVAQFFTPQACEAAGITGTTFKNWTRGDQPAILLTEHDRSAAGTGSLHLLSFRRVVQLALTAELVALGLAPRRAGIMAACFTDGGTSRRLPGHVYPDGETLLVVHVGADAAKVVHVTRETSLFMVLGRGRTAAVIVHVNVVVANLRQALGL